MRSHTQDLRVTVSEDPEAPLLDRGPDFLVPFLSTLLEGEHEDRKTIANGCFLLLGLTGGIPFIYSAEHATHSKILGDFFAGGVLVTGGSNGAWVFWSLNKKLVQLREPYRAVTRRIYEDQIVSQRAKHPVVNCIAIISTLPYVYKTYVYNDIKWFALLDFFISYGYKALGYYGFWEKIQSSLTYRYSAQIKLLRIMQKTLRTKLKRDVVHYMINLPPEEALRIIPDLLEGSEDRSSAHSLINNLLALDTETPGTLPTVWLKGWPRRIFIGASVLIPINFSIVNGAFSYRGALKVWNNRVFAGVATAMSVTPTFVVDLLVTSQTFETLFDLSFNRCQGLRTSQYEVFYPNIWSKFLIPTFALGISILAASNNIYSTHNFLNSLSTFEGDSAEFLTWFYATANVIFSTYTLVKLSSVALRKYATSRGTNLLKRLYGRLFDAIDNIDAFLARLTPKMFGEFVYELRDRSIEEKLLEMMPQRIERTSITAAERVSLFENNHQAFFARPRRTIEDIHPDPAAPAPQRRGFAICSRCTIM